MVNYSFLNSILFRRNNLQPGLSVQQLLCQIIYANSDVVLLYPTERTFPNHKTNVTFPKSRIDQPSNTQLNAICFLPLSDIEPQQSLP